MGEYDQSKRVNARLCSVIASELESPWSPLREMRIIFRRAVGAYLEDLDGHQYIDLSNGLGAVILGHNDPDVNERLIQCLRDGTDVLAGPSELHAKVGEHIAGDVGEECQVAYFASGTGAVRAAAALLVQATGRRIILSAGYHGWDPFWSPAPDLLSPNAAGVIDFFFCLDYLSTLVARHQGDIAGVVISPDYLYLDAAWYDQFSALCREARLSVLTDEVKQGYRYGSGSSLKRLGYSADLYVFGKCLANGYPLACVAGHKKFLKYARDLVNTGFHERLPFVAAQATLDKLANLEVQRRIQEQGDAFLAQARECVRATRLPIEIRGNGNLFQFVIGDALLEREFYGRAIANGLVFFAGDSQTPSFAFTDPVAAEALVRLSKTLDELKTHFADLKDAPILDPARWLAAFRMMEGFPDHAAPESERARFLRQHAF